MEITRDFIYTFVEESFKYLKIRCFMFVKFRNKNYKLVISIIFGNYLVPVLNSNSWVRSSSVLASLFARFNVKINYTEELVEIRIVFNRHVNT